MMHEECEMNEKMKLKPKTNRNATKHKVNMTCQDEESIDQSMTRAAKVCVRGGYVQCMTNAWKIHMWGSCVKYTTNEPKCS